MTTTLVTGGCGFIGSNFVRRRLTNTDDEVRNLDALTYAGDPRNLDDVKGHPRYRFMRGDIRDARVVGDAMTGADHVVHFAAESHVDRSIAAPLAFVDTNVAGTATLLEAARKADVRRFHHVSTDEVFGDLPFEGDGRFNEDSPYRPSSPYAASKAAADHLVRAYGRTYGLRYTLTNGSNNFGPYQHPEKAIPRWITQLIDQHTITLYGNGTNVRDWLHVDDYCDAINLVLARGREGHTYCVGGDRPLDNHTVATLVAAEFKRGDDVLRKVAERPGHDRRYAVDSRKIRTELGWTPKRSFQQALRDTVAWYKAHEAWWRPKTQSTPDR